MNDGITKRWCAVDILVDRAATEAIESALNELDSLGTEIDSLRKVKGEPQIVTGFFDTLPDDANIRLAIDDSLRINGFTADAVIGIESRTVEETDWLAEWKKYWKPTEVGRFIISPPWENVEVTDKILIQIEPNMAFGTGTHETTQLCLKAIGDNYGAGQSFLDIGTGTGILAIAVAKLSTQDTEKENKDLSGFSVANIFACDIDAYSVKIARENAVANGVSEHIAFAVGSIREEAPVFDFVSANLTIDVIVPILPLLLEKSRQILLLSGILAEQKQIISDELLKSQMSNFKFETAGEWVSVIVRKNFLSKAAKTQR
ncbi:MAG: 50S ribosomal protein L11 methyltransferase [Pyrinomonadaceae bacterium]